MRVAAPPAANRGRGDRALTGSETEERPEAMLLSRRIICILLPDGRRPPQPDADLARTANPSLAPPPSSQSRSSSFPLLVLRLRYAASPLPEAAIWEGPRRGRPRKLREASGVAVAGSRGEARGEKNSEWERRKGGGFARCTTRFLGAFFSFVTRALSPPVVGDGRRNGKVWMCLHRAP